MHLIKDKKRIPELITMLIIFIVMLFLNIRCPHISDDLHFKFVWKSLMPTADDKPVETMGDIIESMKNYYMLCGGRVVAHFVLYVILTFDKTVFNIINSAIFVYLGWLIYSMSMRKAPKSRLYLPLIYLSLFFFLPTFGDTVFWVSGAVNYLWSAALFLSCIDYFYKNIETDKKHKAVILALMTLLSASTNETTGGMLAVIYIMYLLLNKKKPSLRLIGLMMCIFAGMLVVIAAPGNTPRADDLNADALSITAALSVISYYVKWILGNELFLLMCFILLPIVFAAVHRNKKKKYFIRAASDILTLIIAGAAGIFALSLSAIKTDRPIMLGILLWITAFWKAVPYVHTYVKRFCLLSKKRQPILRKAKIIALSFLILLSAYTGFNVYQCANAFGTLRQDNAKCLINRQELYTTDFLQVYCGPLFPDEGASLYTLTNYTWQWYDQMEKFDVDADLFP